MQDHRGFLFDLYSRNQSLELDKGLKPPLPKSTGTTIVGVIYQDGVVLGADTRATSGSVVAEKNCKKIHYLTPQIYCCGAGTAADADFITSLTRSTLHLHQLNSGRGPRVETAVTFLKRRLFRYQGYIGAALIVGGVDFTGPQLYTVHPHGSTDKLPFVALGSGSLAAISVLESQYSCNMNRQEAMDLVTQAIRAGIFNDLGSGSNVDMVVISSQGTQVLRNSDTPNPKPSRMANYNRVEESPVVLKEYIKYFQPPGQPMDLSQ